MDRKGIPHFLPFKGWNGSADISYRPPGGYRAMQSIPSRSRISKNNVMMRLGAFFFVATGLFFGALLAALAGVSG